MAVIGDVSKVLSTMAGSLEDRIDAGVQAYLNTTLTNSTGHQVAMAVVGSTSVMGSMLMRSRTNGVHALSSQWINGAANELNALLQNPNIEGISIYASRTSVARDVEVSSTPVIQQSISARKYVSDSATPMPRTFSIDGYIQSLVPELDVGATIRPTVVAQAKFLDSCAMSRCPVWYKDDYNRFFLVLITSFKEEHVPDVANALHVNIEMTEYIPYVAEEVMGSSLLTAGMNTVFRMPVSK